MNRKQSWHEIDPWLRSTASDETNASDGMNSRIPNTMLLLGNGASIAISPKFQYSSLYSEAKLGESIRQIFTNLDTTDFELVMRKLNSAAEISRAFANSPTEIDESNIDGNTAAAWASFLVGQYHEVRAKLIERVMEVHVDYHDAEPHFAACAGWLSQFQSVFSLNYDLILYWMINHHNGKGSTIHFKDCFRSQGRFASNWYEYRKALKRGTKETTLFFFPHGNLTLVRSRKGERKVKTKSSLQDAINSAWRIKKERPIFVSEGASATKLAAIKRSHYLSSVYDALGRFEDNRANTSESYVVNNLVVFGWSFGENDAHILDALANRRSLQKVAVSQFGNSRKERTRIREMLRSKLNDQIDVRFFDSQSDGCWTTN